MLYQWSNPGKDDSDINKLNEINLSSLSLREKDLENIIAKRIDELIRTEQLMVIMQERARQEEPDIIAIDQEGIIFIFELKRWESRSENLLQALRYGQKFGRYDYDKLNWFYQSYRHGKDEEISLQQAHQEYFELDKAIEKNKFNKDQNFIIITNGLDYDTWDAIVYWKNKGLKISAQIYRIYKMEEQLYIDFDPYGPILDVPKEEETGIYVVNTNKTYMPNAYIDMVNEKKGAAYYGRKYSIQKIKAGKLICLYHVGVGILGIGKAKTDFMKKDLYKENDEAEYYVPIDFEYLVNINEENWTEFAVHAREINNHFNSNYKFRQTVFQLPYKFAEFIRNKFKEKKRL